MITLVTGVAGFIGFSTARALLQRGDRVVGIDNINDYYDPQLKLYRLAQLEREFGDAFSFHKLDFADYEALERVLGGQVGATVVPTYDPQGLEVAITIPLGRVRDELLN